MKLLTELLALHEARNPALTYTDKKVKGALERVTVALAGDDSGKMTRLTKKYQQLDEDMKALMEARNDLNAEMKDAAIELFDAEDEIVTRVVETVSYTITLSKAERGINKKPKETIDHTAIIKELGEMVPELAEKIAELTQKYTTLSVAADTPSKLLVKSKLDEGLVAKALKWIRSFVSDIKKWGRGYDKRLAALPKI